MTNGIEELAGASLILAVGTNATETHPIVSLRIKDAVRRGAKLVVVDPRRTELADLATRWLRLRVGTDTALFNAMARVIIEEGLADRDFVRDHTVGLEALRSHVQDDTPEWAEEVTGVPAAEIVAAAREYATERPASIAYTLGVTEHTCGVHNVQSLTNLALLCGAIGIPCSGVNPLRGQNNVQGAGDMGCLPGHLPGYQRVDDDGARHRWERHWNARLGRLAGVTKIAAVERMLLGTVRAAWIMGENTVVSDANAAKTRSALEKLDLLVVQDLFLTETARMAHVVLPAAAFTEADGTYTNTERRVQRVRRAVEPPGEAREDWRIIADVARRMGGAFVYGSASDIWDEMARATPILAGISYSRLEREGLQWPCPSPDHPGTPFLHRDLREGRRPGRLQCVPYTAPAEQPDAEFPFVLTTGRRRPAYHTQTQTGRVPAIRWLLPRELAEIHPHDGARLGIADGDGVRIVSRRGHVVVTARLTDRSPEGVVFLSFHHPDEVRTNLLTNDAFDPITETPEFKACAVRIEGCARALRG